MKADVLAKLADRKGDKFVKFLKDIAGHLNHIEKNMHVLNDNMIEINKNVKKLNKDNNESSD